MSQNSGRVVITRTGQQGRTYTREEPVNGKIIVWLETKDYKPILDETNRQKKMLCDPKTLKIIGYCD